MKHIPVDRHAGQWSRSRQASGRGPRRRDRRRSSRRRRCPGPSSSSPSRVEPRASPATVACRCCRRRSGGASGCGPRTRPRTIGCAATPPIHITVGRPDAPVAPDDDLGRGHRGQLRLSGWPSNLLAQQEAYPRMTGDRPPLPAGAPGRDGADAGAGRTNATTTT
jgi:hypothetical protein